MEGNHGIPYKSFMAVDGLLHVKTLGKHGMRLGLCVTPEQRDKILKASHDGTLAGHIGTRRTLSRIEEKYYRHQRKQHVVSYVRVLCQARKLPRREPQEIIKVEPPFLAGMHGIDILDPFPATVGGNKNIIVGVDYLTKWAESHAIPTATAKDAVEFFLKDIMLRHGAPERVATVCGKCFMSVFILVYKTIWMVGRSEKLLHRWHVPYVVLRMTPALICEVKRPRARRTELVHVVRRKRFARESSGEEKEERKVVWKKASKVVGATEEEPARELTQQPEGVTSKERRRPKDKRAEIAGHGEHPRDMETRPIGVRR